MTRGNIDEGDVGPETLSRSLREYKYGFEPFGQQSISFEVSATQGYGAGAPTGTTGTVNAFFTGHNIWVWHVNGTQTTLVPVVTTDGFYDFSLDQVLNDGFELTIGHNLDVATTGGNAPAQYTVGSHACFFRLLFSIEDVSGANFIVGFRKVEAYQADFNDYDELVGIQAVGDSSSTSGSINIVSILNGADTSSTSTGDAIVDGTAYEFLIKVALDGTTTFSINGAPPTTTAAFTFDSGEAITPFIYFLQTSDLCGELKLRRAEWGLLADLSASTLTVP